MSTALIMHACYRKLSCVGYVYCGFQYYVYNRHSVCVFPLPQIDIIGAGVIVWRVRGKIIRSVLCNIVCNNCTQCNAHTYGLTDLTGLWIGFCLTGPISLC